MMYQAVGILVAASRVGVRRLRVWEPPKYRNPHDPRARQSSGLGARLTELYKRGRELGGQEKQVPDDPLYHL